MKAKTFTNVKLRTEPDKIVRYSAPSVCYQSGGTVYDEGLIDGCLLGRYWNATGQILPELHILRYFDRAEALHLPNHSFQLEIDGQSMHNHWKWAGFSQDNDSAAETCHSVIELEHELKPVKVYVHTRLDGTGIIERWLEIENLGNEHQALGRVCPWSGRLWTVDNYPELMGPEDRDVFTLGYMYHGYWCHEGEFTWESLNSGITRKASRCGASGHRHPFFIVRNEATGEHFIGSLGWSGNHYMEFRVDLRAETGSLGAGEKDAHLFFGAGPLASNPQRLIAPGEKITTPGMHLGCIHDDLDHCVQTMHEHVRKSVLPVEPKQLPVVFNTYGGIEDWYFDDDNLREMADSAVEIGAEMFMIDAGWYGPKEHSWPGNRGDYYAGDWLPNDLHPIRAYVKKKGLLFGLWMDAESLGADCSVLKEHPDWEVYADGNKNLRTGVLDLTKPEVAEHMENMIADMIGRYELDVFRLDYNNRLFGGGEAAHEGCYENNMWRYYEAFYGIFGRLRAKFPYVIFENCASGGGRIDYGIMRHFHYTQISDTATSMPRNIVTLNGMTMMMPPESVFSAVGFLPCIIGSYHGVNRMSLYAGMAQRLYIASGLAMKVADWNPVAAEMVKGCVKLYKDFIRPMLADCNVYHHTPILKGHCAQEWCVLEYASPKKDKAFAVLFRLTGKNDEYHFHPRGLDTGTDYRVTLYNEGENFVSSGMNMARDGIVVRQDHKLAAQMILMEKK